MLNNYNDISQIEAYLQGRLQGPGREGFEAQLADNEAFRQEVEAYRQIFSGLDGLQEERFTNEVAAWTAEAKRKAISQQTPEAKIVPINRGATVRSVWRQVALAASIILVVGIGAAWWQSQQFSNEKLVAAAYSRPLSSGTMGGEATQAGVLEQQFESAHEAFAEGDFGSAATQFGQFIQALESSPGAFDPLTTKSFLDNAKWTLALSQFASGSLSDEQFGKVLDVFANDPASEYSGKAQKMKEDLGSFWRKF